MIFFLTINLFFVEFMYQYSLGPLSTFGSGKTRPAPTRSWRGSSAW